MQGFHPAAAATCSSFTPFEAEGEKKRNPSKMCMDGLVCLNDWLLCSGFELTRTGFRERERVVEEDEGRKTRGGGGARAVGLLLRWRAVKGIIPPPPPRPPTHLPATSHTSHIVTHFFLGSNSASHRLQSTAACVGKRAHVCVSFSKLCVVLQLNLLGLSSR